MIFGNINNMHEYKFLEEKIKKCLEYSKNNKLIEYENGKYVIDGENIFVNVVEYETADRESRFFEAHRKYIDLHFMLRGEEIIDVEFIDNMDQKEFQEENDFLPLENSKYDKNTSVMLRENNFLICYPNDAHMTGINVCEPVKIKKAIFKIII